MVGVDIVYVPRFRKAIEKHGERFLKRVFSDEELRLCFLRANPDVCLAGRWACKEAVFKAFYAHNGTKLRLRDIEITKGPEGEPVLRIKGREEYRIKVSISHDGDYAIAVAYVLK
ncbi:MAG: holo-ACP synthase [Aquificaceae bacterium]|nr:holo-ACP synthase [Aquificaceae bacterium]MDW8236813.1 holo-ACP synthase [Aquificaceae bacterium]